MKPGYTTNLRYIVGAAYGLRNTKNPAYDLKYGDNQEDKERTLRYWTVDKILIRFNDIAPKTAYYAKGGIFALYPNRIKDTKAATETILAEFPQYVRQVHKKAKGTYDLLFRTGKIARAAPIAADTGIQILPIRDRAAYETARTDLLAQLQVTTIPPIQGGLPGSGPGRGQVIGRIGRTMSFGYGIRTFKGYGEFAMNTKYPTLLKLLVSYGNLVVPTGWRYETITVNYGVKAKKHKDAKNSGESVIVGIGDFTGGDIKVWNTDDVTEAIYNLHDQPLMFNGSTHFHETMPFDGERYTFIFYRQKRPGKTDGVTMMGDFKP
jgi:hypothetical protein